MLLLKLGHYWLFPLKHFNACAWICGIEGWWGLRRKWDLLDMLSFACPYKRKILCKIYMRSTIAPILVCWGEVRWKNGLHIWMVEWIIGSDEDWLVQHHIGKIASPKGKNKWNLPQFKCIGKMTRFQWKVARLLWGGRKGLPQYRVSLTWSAFVWLTSL